MSSSKKNRELANLPSASDRSHRRQQRSELLEALVEKSLGNPDPLTAQILSSACDVWEIVDELQPLIIGKLRESDDKLAAFNDIEPPLDAVLKAHHLAERYVQLFHKVAPPPAVNGQTLPDHAGMEVIGESDI